MAAIAHTHTIAPPRQQRDFDNGNFKSSGEDYHILCKFSSRNVRGTHCSIESYQIEYFIFRRTGRLKKMYPRYQSFSVLLPSPQTHRELYVCDLESK